MGSSKGPPCQGLSYRGGCGVHCGPLCFWRQWEQPRENSALVSVPTPHPHVTHSAHTPILCWVTQTSTHPAADIAFYQVSSQQRKTNIVFTNISEHVENAMTKNR